MKTVVLIFLDGKTEIVHAHSVTRTMVYLIIREIRGGYRYVPFTALRQWKEG